MEDRKKAPPNQLPHTPEHQPGPGRDHGPSDPAQAGSAAPSPDPASAESERVSDPPSDSGSDPDEAAGGFLDHRISLFERVWRPQAKLDDVTVRSFIADIRRGRWDAGVRRVREASTKDRREPLKKRLPCVTPSGTFTRRKNVALNEHSGLVVLDVDGAEDPELVRTQVSAVPHTAAAFISPSGRGVKVFVAVACTDRATGEERAPRDNTEHGQAYDAATATYETVVSGIEKIDEGKDVARACFVSYDEDAYVNETPEPLSVTLRQAVRARPSAPAVTISETPSITIAGAHPVPGDTPPAIGPLGGTPNGDRARYSAKAIVAAYVKRATEHARQTGQTNRNSTGFDLAIQLRDNGYSEEEALEAGEAYVSAVAPLDPSAPYTLQEYEASVQQAYSAPARRPWGLTGNAPACTLTDLGNAERLVWQYAHDLRYSHGLGAWFVYDGVRWVQDASAAVMRRAIAAVKGIYEEAAAAGDSDRRREIAKHAARSESAPRLKAMVEAATWMGCVQVHTDELDADPLLLNVMNGTVDLTTGHLRAHDRADLITRLAPVPFDPGARCPTFVAFLERIMDANVDLIGYLQRLLGYSLTGLTGEQMMAIFYGGGANGKSTLLETVAGLLGDYAQQTPSETLVATRNRGVPNDVARLRGARFVSAVETGEGNRLDESLVKQMTGGDRVTARFLYREFFEFTPAFKLFLGTNHKPAIRGTDAAIWRRIHLVPFKVTIPEPERDPRLKAKLAAEAPGILNWALEGCRTWQREGLQPPAEVRAATAEYRGEMDVLAAFLEGECVEKAGATVQSSKLYDAYKNWCDQNGEHAVNNRDFSSRLEERGFEKVRKDPGRFWLGLGLLADPSRLLQPQGE